MNANNLFTPYYFKSLESTNSWAKKAYSEGKIDSGDVIVTETQTAGRGQMRTMWHDEFGKNALFTVVIDVPNFSVAHFFRINAVVSLAIVDVLSSIMKTEIKWPNDIYIGNKKVGGILLETIIQGNFIKTAFIGIGLNINQLIFPEGVNATSLAVEISKELDKNEIILQILEKLSTRIAQLHAPNLLRNQYFKNLKGTSTFYRYQTETEQFWAKIHKIEEDGRLVLQKKNNATLHYFNFKEVQMVFAT